MSTLKGKNHHQNTVKIKIKNKSVLRAEITKQFYTTVHPIVHKVQFYC